LILKGFTVLLVTVLVVFLFLEVTSIFIGPIFSEKAYTTVATDEDLIESFSKVVHFIDSADNRIETKAVKWPFPMRFAFFGKVPDWHRVLIRRYLNLISRLTKLEFEEVPEGIGQANYRFYFAKNKDDMIRIGIENGQNENDLKELVPTIFCYAFFRVDRPKRLPIGIMVISGEKNNRQTKGCIAEEMTHALCLLGHNATYSPTIYSNKEFPEKLSINDKILLRTLYDERIKIGMTRKETTPIAKQIVEELVPAVKERGEEALYQR
jgi:hypothetical protein